MVSSSPFSSVPPRVLTIAGSDTSGGAGIQADLKTLSACGTYALTAITALTAQDPGGVQGMWPVSPEQLRIQIDAALAYQPVAIKVGMLATAALVDVVADTLASCPGVPLVLDTIVSASSGARLLDDDGIVALRERLLPRATLVTPNRQEARIIAGSDNEAALQRWAREHGVSVLLTGGDSSGLTSAGEARFCTDVLIMHDSIEHLTLPRVETPNSHGTGCTLTAAIAAFLAHGFPLPEAVQHGRQFVHRALQAAAPQAWPGCGPLNHFFAFGSNTAQENAP